MVPQGEMARTDGCRHLLKACAQARLKHVFGYSLTMERDRDPGDIKIYALTGEGLHNLLLYWGSLKIPLLKTLNITNFAP